MMSESQNHIELLRNGLGFIEKMVKTINKAEKYIMLHTYILNIDEVTGPIIKALTKKAESNIPVYLICDAVGSHELSESSIQLLRNSKINFEIFHGIKQLNQIGRRLHQKVLLVDGLYVILGGINLSKRFNLPEGQNPWLDYSAYLEGEEAKFVLLKILPIYQNIFKEHDSFFYKLKKGNQGIFKKNNSLVKTHVNDWMKYKNRIYKSYIQAIKKSQTSITLMATYFIPGKKLLKELRLAKKRGVQVNLVFCNTSDHPFISKVEQYFYGWYLQNGFNIFEWSQSVMHGKIALIDDNWCSIGSYNHNYISRYGNLEINFEITDLRFTQLIKDEFMDVISKSRKIDDASFHLQYSFLDKSFNFLVYILTNFITLISLLFIFKRSKDREIV